MSIAEQQGIQDARDHTPLYEDLQISDWLHKNTVDIDGIGVLETSVVSFEDGSRFVHRKAIPSNQRWPTSVDFTPPLGTHVNGFNTDLLKKLAARGMHSRLVGANQSQGFSLEHDALATLHILNQDDMDPTCSTGESIQTGYSMGIMKALGELAFAGSMGRDIKLTIGLDPCLATPVHYSIDPITLSSTGAYLGREMRVLGQMAGEEILEGHPLRAITKLKQAYETFRPTPAHIFNQIDKWNSIASGETKNFPAQIPKDSLIILHFFKHCKFNNQAIYRELFADHPNVKFIEEDGYHLSGADDEVIDRVINKTEASQDMLQGGYTKEEMANALSGPILTKNLKV